MWNDNFRKSWLLLDKLIVMVTSDSLGNKNNFFDASQINIKGHQVSASSFLEFEHSGQKHFGGPSCPSCQIGLNTI